MSERDRHNGALIRKDSALAGAAVSAAVGLAVYGLRKALAEGGRRMSLPGRDDPDEHEHERGERDRSLREMAWESGSDALVSLAEDAAEMAGKWVARNSPALVRERLLPRFIDSFKAAG
jgi:hypothetical protein